MSDDARSNDDRGKDDAAETGKPPHKQIAPWANERRFDPLTPEQMKKLCREIADIQREQRELGLEQRGPALGPN